MLPLLVGAAALLAAVGASEAQVRRRKLVALESLFASVQIRGPAPPPEVVEQVEEALASMLALVPHLGPVLGQLGLVLDGSRWGGWYLPDTRRILIGWKGGNVALVTHEAFHALDDALGPGQGRYASWQTESVARAVAEEARQILADQLDAYSDQLVTTELRKSLPPRLVARLLTMERFPLREAVRDLLDEQGERLDPDNVAEDIRDARFPMGGVDATALLGKYGELGNAFAYLGGLLPVGIPLSMFGRPEAERVAWFTSVSLKDKVRNSKDYHRSLHEVWARLSDQSLRRAAELHGLFLPGPSMAPELEMTPEGLLLLEPRLWKSFRR